MVVLRTINEQPGPQQRSSVSLVHLSPHSLHSSAYSNISARCFRVLRRTGLLSASSTAISLVSAVHGDSSEGNETEDDCVKGGRTGGGPACEGCLRDCASGGCAREGGVKDGCMRASAVVGGCTRAVVVTGTGEMCGMLCIELSYSSS